MPGQLRSVLDGACTAAAITLVALLLGERANVDEAIVGARLFYTAGLLVIGSLFVTAFGRRSPPGVLGALRGRPAPPPSPVPGRDAWFDRFASLDNTWLLAAFALVLISLAPPFIGLE